MMTDASQPETQQQEVRCRRLFAEAQERFAAGDFAGARKRLLQIPPSGRSRDAARLLELTTARLRELATLRREMEAACERGDKTVIATVAQRLLELQPDDERARELLCNPDEATSPTETHPGKMPPPLPPFPKRRSPPPLPDEQRRNTC